MSNSSFFLLQDKIQSGITDILKWNKLTSIQEETIPYILNGHNCILVAQTAGGKTEAAFLPIINEIFKDKLNPISVIYISPIRALLNNQELRLKKLGKIANIDAFKWHGEVDSNNKTKFKIEPKHIIATTPESLEVMLMSNSYDRDNLFSNIRFIVIDEIHYFAENYRGSQLISIIERIQTYSKYDIQRIGLSATVGNPEDILQWMSGSSKRSGSVIRTNGNLNKSKVFIRYFEEFTEDYMIQLLPELKNRKSLFFCNSRTGAEATARTLKSLGLNAKVHHSSISKGLREKSEEILKSSIDEMVLCCTSTMELGIDVGELDVVMQLNCPPTVASFRQRMGRTGRREGTIPHYEFCINNELALVNSIAIVELSRKKWIESINTSSAAYTVLFQQIISMIEQKYGLRKDYLQEILKNSGSFHGIDSNSLGEFCKYMIEQKYIDFINCELLIGEETEKKYGYNLVMNFVSVFETLPEFSIIYKNKQIGTLQSWFVYALLKENQNSKFTLAGVGWEIEKIDYDKYKVYVQKSKSSELAKWMSSATLISYEISKEMLKVLNSDEEYVYIDNKAKSTLESIRMEHSAIAIKDDEILIDVVKNGFDIFTYAGHKVNFVLGLILECEYGFEFSVTYNKIRLKNGNEKIKVNHIVELLNELSGDSLKINEIIKKSLISSNLKSHSKFYEYLPYFAKNEVLKYELLDLINTERLLKESRIIVEDAYEKI